jgi:hypothetical protein
MARPLKYDQSVYSGIVDLYRDGKSIYDLSELYSMTPMGISKVLKRAGVATRGITQHLPEWARINRPTITVSSNLPQVIACVGNLAVALVDQDLWDVASIQNRFNKEHAEAKYWLRNLKAEINSKGFNLLALWKDELNLPGIARMIAHKNNKDDKIAYARECEIAMLSAALADKFYDTYHLQGGSGSPINIALVFKDEVVACMSFNHGYACRGDKEAMLLQRFAAAGSVPGAASRLLAAFRKDNKQPVISYSDERYALGRLYEVLGFKEIELGNPDYRYWRDGRWYSKSSKQKKFLFKEMTLAGLEFTPKTTESTMAATLGYKKCYDCGKKTWRLE